MLWAIPVLVVVVPWAWKAGKTLTSGGVGGAAAVAVTKELVSEVRAARGYTQGEGLLSEHVGVSVREDGDSLGQAIFALATDAQLEAVLGEAIRREFLLTRREAGALEDQVKALANETADRHKIRVAVVEAENRISGYREWARDGKVSTEDAGREISADQHLLEQLAQDLEHVRKKLVHLGKVLATTLSNLSRVGRAK